MISWTLMLTKKSIVIEKKIIYYRRVRLNVIQVRELGVNWNVLYRKKKTNREAILFAQYPVIWRTFPIRTRPIWFYVYIYETEAWHTHTPYTVSGWFNFQWIRNTVQMNIRCWRYSPKWIRILASGNENCF